MHSKMPLLAALALLILVETDANSPSPPPAQSSRPSSAKPAVESNDTLIVVLKHGYTAFSCAPFQDIVKRVGPAAGDKYPFGAFRITDSSVSSATALQRIQACPEVADVTWDLELEKNTIDIVTLHPTPTAPGRRIHQTRTTAPDDPLYTDMGSWAHEAMSTLQAWGTSEGTATIPICMVDTGLLPSHPDLQDNLWVNTGEIPGDGIDNDGNGFVDDVHGVREYLCIILFYVAFQTIFMIMGSTAFENDFNESCCIGFSSTSGVYPIAQSPNHRYQHSFTRVRQRYHGSSGGFSQINSVPAN